MLNFSNVTPSYKYYDDFRNLPIGATLSGNGYDGPISYWVQNSSLVGSRAALTSGSVNPPTTALMISGQRFGLTNGAVDISMYWAGPSGAGVPGIRWNAPTLLVSGNNLYNGYQLTQAINGSVLVVRRQNGGTQTIGSAFMGPRNASGSIMRVTHDRGNWSVYLDGRLACYGFDNTFTSGYCGFAYAANISGAITDFIVR